jgi:hypothetical protein
VEELAARMSAREFHEWMVYDAVEGLPDTRADWRAGMLASVIANVNRKKGAPAHKPADFMPRPPKPKAASTPADRLAGLVRMLETRAHPPR